MRERRILASIVSIAALSAAPALASELSANITTAASVITVSTGYVKVDTQSEMKKSKVSENSKVQTSKWKKRDNNKVLIMGGREVIPL